MRITIGDRLWNLMSCVIIISLLAACGGSSAEPTSSTGGGSTGSTSSPVAGTTQTGGQIKPEQGGQLRFPLTGDPDFLIPIIQKNLNGTVIATHIFSRLYRAAPDNSPEPDLAESYTASADATVWTFKLRSGVKWHDGQPFTADDVKFSIEQYMDPKNAARAAVFLTDIKTTEVVSPTEIRFTLSRPNAGFLAAMENPIVPKHLLENIDDLTKADFNKHPIGTGPFVFKEWVPGDHVLIEANKDYFNGRPNLDSILFKVVPDGNAQAAQVRTGELSFITVTPALADQFANKPEFQMNVHSDMSVWGEFFNDSKAPFDDVKVRQAFTYAVDKDALVKSVMKGYAEVAWGPMPDGFGEFFNPNVTKYPYDVEKAKALLEEAGWKASGNGRAKDGKPLSVELCAQAGEPTQQALAVAVQQYWEKIGAQVQVKLLPFNQLLNDCHWTDTKDVSQNYNAFGSTPDPSSMETRWLSNLGPRNNMMNYHDPKVDELLAKGKEELDPAKRQQAYWDFQELIASQAALLPLYYSREIAVLASNIQGVPPSASQPLIYYADSFWIKK